MFSQIMDFLSAGVSAVIGIFNQFFVVLENGRYGYFFLSMFVMSLIAGSLLLPIVGNRMSSGMSDYAKQKNIKKRKSKPETGLTIYGE